MELDDKAENENVSEEETEQQVEIIDQDPPSVEDPETFEPSNSETISESDLIVSLSS
jgi:hypothetical protein